MTKRKVGNDLEEVLKVAATGEELSTLVATLIENRKRDYERRKRTLARDLLLEEIACFKDTIALHRRLMENHDPPRD